MKVMYIYVYIVNQTERIFIWICIICRQATCNVSYCGSLCVCVDILNVNVINKNCFYVLHVIKLEM